MQISYNRSYGLISALNFIFSFAFSAPYRQKSIILVQKVKVSSKNEEEYDCLVGGENTDDEWI